MNIRQIGFYEAEDEWKRMYRSNPLLSPYSSFKFAECYRRFFHLGLKRIFMGQRFYIVSEGHQAKAIIPLIHSRGRYYLYGDMCASGYLDIITGKQLSDGELDECFSLLLQKLGKSRLYLNKINDKSGLCPYLLEKYHDAPASPCVNITFGDEYEDYYNSLSKSMRQNIRTAYNRMNREEHKYEFRVLNDCNIDKETACLEMKVYKHRAEHKNGKKENAVAGFVRNNFNPITTSTSMPPDNLHALFYIDGELAAFLAGYVTNDKKTIVVPRLAIDDRFSLYCVGSLLVTELVKYCTKNCSVRNIDLSRGDEKYKYSLGGVTHYNHTFVMCGPEDTNK